MGIDSCLTMKKRLLQSLLYESGYGLTKRGKELNQIDELSDLNTNQV